MAVSLTGQPVFSASRPSGSRKLWSSRSAVAPGTPVTTIFTRSGSRSNAAAASSRSPCGSVEARYSSTPPSGRGTASPASAPMGAGSWRPMRYRPSTTSSPAASGSPWRSGMWRIRLPSGCSGSASKACSGSITGSSTSYSTMTAAAAIRAVSGWSAATAAMASPWWRTTSEAKTGRSDRPRSYTGVPGTSSWVTTACTPGISRAWVVSMDAIRACGCGERSTAAHSRPSAHRSAAYGKVPSVWARVSAAGRETPSPRGGASVPAASSVVRAACTVAASLLMPGLRPGRAAGHAVRGP